MEQPTIAGKTKFFRLLLLDDNPADVAAISRILEEIPDTQYHTHKTSTIKEALAFLEKNQDIIDLCLVDYRLYGQTAFHFLAELEAHNIMSLPIVVMTGYADSTIDKKLMAEGVQEYWDKKDLNPDTLERCIRYAVHRHTQIKQRTCECKEDSRHLLQINNDLKPALKTITGMTKVLEHLIAKENLSEAERINNCFNEIATATQQLATLIDDITALSEVEIGKLVLYRSSFSLNHLIREIYASYLPAATNCNIVLHIKIDGTIDIYGDEARIRQVIQNLVSNALKFTTEGSITVAVTQHSSDDGNRVEIRVADTGCGISDEQKLTLFSFTKEKAGYELTNIHSGFGLPITKRIIELHGGHIEVESQIAVGSTFTITLPQRGSK